MSDTEPKHPQIAWDAWKYDQDRKAAEAIRAHGEHQAYGLEHFKATIAFGVEAIRTTALINGGALVASLALVGATANSAPQLAPHIIRAVFTFAIGVLCAGGAASAAYLTQFCFANGHAYVIRAWERPFVTTTRPGKWWERFGIGFQVIAFGAVVASYVMVLLGALRIYRAWMP